MSGPKVDIALTASPRDGTSCIRKTLLAKKFQNLGYSVSYHLEGEQDSPLDLCWVAYMSKSEYEILLNTYTDLTPWDPII